MKWRGLPVEKSGNYRRRGVSAGFASGIGDAPEIGEAMQDDRAVVCGHRRPATVPEGIARGADRCIDLGGFTRGHLREHGAITRVQGFEGPAAFRLHPFSSHIHFTGLRGEKGTDGRK